MSETVTPLALEDLPHFFVPLPPDTDATRPWPERRLACSANYVVVGHGLTTGCRIYVYSLPTFNLVHVLEPQLEEVPDEQSFQIHGEILVVTSWKRDDDGPSDSCSMSFWDLSVGKLLNGVTLPDHFSHPTISIPYRELIETEENGNLVKEEWPKNEMLILCSPGAEVLCVVAVHRSGGHDNPIMAPLMTLPIHAAVTHFSMGKTVITGGADATVRVWDITTGECRLVLMGHRNDVTGVRMNATRIYSWSADGAARIWDRHSGDCLHVLDLLNSATGSIAGIAPSYFITPMWIHGEGARILIWDPVSGQIAHRIDTTLSVHCHGPIFFAKERTLMAWQVFSDIPFGQIDIWDVRSGKMLIEQSLGYDHNRPLAVCSQARFLIVLVKKSEDDAYMLRVWDFSLYGSPTDEPEPRIDSLGDTTHFSVPLPTDYHPDDRDLSLECSATHVVLVQRANHRVYVYSLPTFDVNVLELAGVSHLDSISIYGDILVARGTHVSQAERQKCLHFYDLSTGQSFGVFPHGYRRVDISFPGTEVIEIEENGKLVREEWPKKPTFVICFAERILQTCTLHRSFKQSGYNIDAQAEDEQESATMVPGPAIALSHNARVHASIGRTAVTAGSDATVRVWDVITGECLQVLIGHLSAVFNVCLDSARIYSSSKDNTVRIWDRHCGDCLHAILDHIRRITSPFTFVKCVILLMQSPPQSNLIHRLRTTPPYLIGTTFETPAQGCTTLVWDAGGGRLVQNIAHYGEGFLGPVRGGEHTLVTGEWDCLRVWDVNSGRVLIRLSAGTPPELLEFCAQDRFVVALVAQGQGYTLRVWDFGDDRLASAKDDVLPVNSG
ncbi:hypothetical protein CVT26_014443 [Gymnopilus dilepis]|uniref:WD40 repeat-like protein n=1 Tax=Gymnopilus dilepis TaxID=231916 RepID=A0A409VV76_9AGAR|nr:hypothetical protein CVT26_014443 [Gymnopilus dilepis]